MARPLSEPALLRLATAGAALSVIVVGASALLRLGTSLDAGGNVLATLPASLQQGTRLAHRIAATGVALIGLVALGSAFLPGSAVRARLKALGAVLALVALLAAIGPWTPGYRFATVTLVNAAGGIALACAFVWLGAGATRLRRAALAALVIVLLHSALGAAASFGAMHGTRALDPLHVALGPVAAAAVVFTALRRSESPSSRGLRAGLVAMAMVQMALGAAVAAAPSLGIAWAHALGACLLAALLAALAARR